MSLNQVELSKGSPPSDRLVVWAGGGEANLVAVARGAGGELQVTRSGRPAASRGELHTYRGEQG